MDDGARLTQRARELLTNRRADVTWQPPLGPSIEERLFARGVTLEERRELVEGELSGGVELEAHAEIHDLLANGAVIGVKVCGFNPIGLLDLWEEMLLLGHEVRKKSRFERTPRVECRLLVVVVDGPHDLREQHLETLVIVLHELAQRSV